MEKFKKCTPEMLQLCSYRSLQQTAKALCLPSNVKKISLIKLIHLKKNGSDDEVEKLVDQVLYERKQTSAARKRAKDKKKYAQQSTEISSTNSTRPMKHIMIRYRPEQYSPKRRLSRPIPQSNAVSKSTDRVLRSYGALRSSRIRNNRLPNVINNTEERDKNIENVVVCKTNRQVESELAVCKNSWKNHTKVVPVKEQKAMTSHITPQIIHNKNQRRLSGIYPLNEETIPTKYIGFRRPDGTIVRLNAYVQKALPTNETDNNVALLTADPTETLPTISAMLENYGSLGEISENPVSIHNPIDGNASYEKNAELGGLMTHYKCMDTATDVNDYPLPVIDNVYSSFNCWNATSESQPMYIQASGASDMVLNTSAQPDMQNYDNNVLENIYNVKNTFLINQPLVQVTTTSNTHCTFTTSTVSAAKAQTSTLECSVYNNALQEDSSNHDAVDPRVTEFFRQYCCNEEDRSIASESPLSQVLGANSTASEMVDDAYELISQDGDYMERMGLDARMQCIFCDWSGPKIVLEYHLRKDHSSEILPIDYCEWTVNYSLGTLMARKVWHNKVLDRASQLYVISTKYVDPDCFYAVVSTISSEFDIPRSGSITTYNKVTGQPFTWKGTIPELPANLHYDYDPDCLKLELSKLGLLHNSANIQLLNRELVLRSPGKVVIGQPELHNIQISIVIKLDNCGRSCLQHGQDNV